MTLPPDCGIRILLPKGDRFNTDVTAGDMELFGCSPCGMEWRRHCDE
jgi:hypothetical protein